MVLPVMVGFVGVLGRFIPETKEDPVVKPFVPPCILFAVEFPIVFPEIVMEEATPEIFIPVTPPEIAAVTPDEKSPPITLLRMEITLVEEEFIPTTIPPAVVGIPTNKFAPDEPPMIFGVTVPMLAEPPVILIPQRIPFVVEAPLEVLKLIAVIVFP